MEPTEEEAMSRREMERPAKVYPKKIRLPYPHGFIDDFGQNKHWDAGTIVGDPHEVKLLVDRGAVFEVVE